MLQILLMILKIIGILLLVLLGILLIGMGLILFVPIKYHIDVEIKEKAKASIKVNWLLHLIDFRLKFFEKLDVTARILGFIVFSNDPEYANKKEVKRNKKLQRKKYKDNTDVNLSNSSNDEVNNDSVQEENSSEESISQTQKDQEILEKDINFIEEQMDKAEDFVEEEIKKQERNLIQKLKELWNSFVYFLFHWEKGYHNFKKKWMNLYNNITYYCNVFQSDAAKQSFLLCKNELIRFGKMISPYKWSAYLKLGFDDPAVLGQILSYYCMGYPIWGNKFKIEPEFERTIFEGTFKAKGRIRICTILYIAIKIYFSKNIRTFIQLLNKEEF